jgi:hypothetical protein
VLDKKELKPKTITYITKGVDVKVAEELISDLFIIVN